MSVPSGPGKTPHFQWKLADDVEPKLAEGFRRHPTLSPLTQPWEPIYSRLSEQSVELGLRIRHEHCDGRQVAHGGLISTLADHAMALSCLLYPRDERAATSGPSTLNLACDLIGTGRPGQWLEARPGAAADAQSGFCRVPRQRRRQAGCAGQRDLPAGLAIPSQDLGALVCRGRVQATPGTVRTRTPYRGPTGNEPRCRCHAG